MRIVLICLASLMFAGCGLDSPQAVIDNPRKEWAVVVDGKLGDVFQTAVTSEHWTNEHVQHSLNESGGEGMIWSGHSDMGTYAVVKFQRKGSNTTKVGFYYYSGMWDEQLKKTRDLLIQEYGKATGDKKDG